MAPPAAVGHNGIVNGNGHPMRWSLEDFERGPMIGNGRFGSVYKCTERRSQHQFAIKICSVQVMNRNRLAKEQMEKQVQREIAIQHSLNQPLPQRNILKLYGFFVDEVNLYVVLELAEGGELMEQIKQQPLSEEDAAIFVWQLVQALQHCHKSHIIHRDIKPENLLIGKDGELRMSDFGWAVEVGSEAAKRLTLCGTADYLAPEMLDRSGHDLKADIWCLGILTFEMLYQKPPFEEETIDATAKRILKAQWNFPRVPQVSANAKDLITQCLQKDPVKRITLDKIAQHPWLYEHVDASRMPLKQRQAARTHTAQPARNPSLKVALAQQPVSHHNKPSTGSMR